jgi:hypothetical protein
LKINKAHSLFTRCCYIMVDFSQPLYHKLDFVPKGFSLIRNPILSRK